MDGIDVVGSLSSALQVPPYFLIVIISLGFSALFTFFFKKKIYKKLQETEKFFLSLIIGIITYFLVSYIIFSLYGFWTLLFYKPSVNFFNDVAISCFTIIGCLWIIYFSDYDVEKITGLLLEFLMILMILITISQIVVLFSSLFTSYKFLFLFFSFYTISLIFFGIIPVYIIRKKIKPKEFPLVKFIKKNYKSILLIVVISFVAIFISFLSFLFPRVIYENKITQFYLFNGNRYNIEYLNDNPYLWLSYKNVISQIELKNSGFFGWIPINYGNIISDDENITSYMRFSLLISTDENNYYFLPKNPDKSSLNDLYKNTGIKDLGLEKSNSGTIYNNIIIIFDRFNFLDLKKIRSINISGWEFNDQKLFSIKEGEPDIREKGITIYINFTNNLDKDSVFQDIQISKYNNYKNKWIECNISSIRGFSDGIISTNIVFKNGAMQGLAKIDPNFYFDGSKSLVLNQLTIGRNSTYSMTINLVCQK